MLIRAIELNVKWVKARVLSVGVDVLLAIKNTGIATASEVQQQAMQTEGIRWVQRYLNSMVQAGLLYAGKSKFGEAKRYYLTGKAKQLKETNIKPWRLS